MKHKRAIITAVIIWLSIFIILSILMFLPFLKEKEMIQYFIFWVLLIPITLFSAKWYFRMDPPTLKKGLYLGLIILGVSLVFDIFITVPVFVKSYMIFFGNWRLYIGFSEIILLCTYAGWEFDDTYTKASK
jgi:hypothetical protein